MAGDLNDAANEQSQYVIDKGNRFDSTSTPGPSNQDEPKSDLERAKSSHQQNLSFSDIAMPLEDILEEQGDRKSQKRRLPVSKKSRFGKKRILQETSTEDENIQDMCDDDSDDNNIDRRGNKFIIREEFSKNHEL